MAKYCGMIGFSSSSETKPGVWEDVVTERKYRGDIVRDYRRSYRTDEVVRDYNISNTFSIVADSYMYENFQFLKYLRYLGVAWKIESVEVQYPRLLISVGGVWNGAVPTVDNSSQQTRSST